MDTFKNLHTNIKIRLLERFLNSLVANMVFPFMIIYFAGIYGGFTAGLLFAFSAFISVIVSLYGGALTDNIGRKSIMLISEYFRLASIVIMILATLGNSDLPILLYIMMIISSICSAVSQPASQAMLIDVSTSDNRKVVYTLEYWSFNITVFIGSMVGGFFFKDYLTQLLIFVALMSLVSIYLLKFYIIETFNTKKEKFKSKISMINYKEIIKNPIFIMFLFAAFLDLSIQFQSTKYNAVRLSEQFGETDLLSIGNFVFTVDGMEFFGVLNSINTLIVIAFTVIIMKFVRNLSKSSTIKLGILMYSIGYAVVSFSNQPYMLILAMAIATIGEIIYVPQKQALLADIIPEESKGSHLAVNDLTFKAASMFGALSVTIGSFIPSLIMGILFFIGGLISLFLFVYVIKNQFANNTKESNQNVV
jgi:DHA1 family multidrug resistance protein B-like MFS transporter